MAQHTIGVVGTGTMGCGIAQVAAQAGYEVVFQNRKQESVDRGLGRIRTAIERLVARPMPASPWSASVASCRSRSSRAASA
jgi:3-hydroxyacyl-CoA dehydrogenase